jgi:hypothetical protein
MRSLQPQQKTGDKPKKGHKRKNSEASQKQKDKNEKYLVAET